jgi:hypothetical protein
MRKKSVITLLTVVIFSCSSFLQAFAQEPSREELMGRVSTLEQEVAQLKEIISNIQSQQYAVERKVDEIKTESLASAVTTDKGVVTSKHDVKLYGFLKLDTSFDDSKTDNPDAPKYAQSSASSNNEKEFAMTAGNSRFGLKYYGPEDFETKVFGNLELDFYDTASDNSQKPRMRHAFFELQYPKWSLLAGQTWDIFGPLGPNTLNTNGYLWNGGNIGFRRPQIRLTNKFDLKKDSKITTQLSVNRNIGDTLNTVNSGEDSSQPVVEGRVAYSFPLFDKVSTIGVEGLYGREKYNDLITKWAGGLDFSVPIGDKLSLKGEFFQGTNLNDFLAGIGQGINTSKNDGIDTIGGWAQISFKPWEKYCFNIGYGIDKPERKDLNDNDRFRNDVIFANVMYSIFKDVKLGLEYSYFQTKYVNSEDGKNNRVATSLIYSF